VGEGRYVWTSSDQNLGAPKNSGLTLRKKEGEMGEKDRHQSIGIDLVRPNDSTSWKRALKSKPGRTANDRKLIFSRQAKPGILNIILNYVKDRVNENHHRG
jgi:hypothetical protein